MRFALILFTALLLQSPKPSPQAQAPATTSDPQKAEADHTGMQGDPVLLLTVFITLAAVTQAVTAIVQACIYGKQSRIMKETLSAIRIQANTMDAQTKILSESVAIAKQSAETTASSLKAMIDKERARLSIEIGKLDFGEWQSVHYRITCHGTTPAYVISSWQLTGLYPIPDFGWSKEAFGFELDNLPSVIPVGIFEGYNFIMGTSRKPGPFAHAEWGDIENKISSGESYLYFRVRVLYRDIFDDVRTHELQISKIYGVRLQDKPQTLSERPYGKPTEKVLGTLPEWRDSAYKFGEVEE